MSLSGVLRAYRNRIVRAWTVWKLRRKPANLSLSLGKANWASSLQDPTGFYFECWRHFLQELPTEFREHRAYFQTARRGFGEDSFHVMWKLLLDEFKPANFLEIGVFRGQVISLVALWSRKSGATCEVWGISPFSGAGDSGCSYRCDLDYYRDTLLNFDHFGLPHPKLLRAYSTDPKAAELIASRQWDMIYIDGNHDYEVVLQDWENCSRNLKLGGIIVLDDAGLTSAFRAPIVATAGIAGPSRLAQEIDRSRFRELLQVGHNRAFVRIA
jgi:hypothetical protein